MKRGDRYQNYFVACPLFSPLFLLFLHKICEYVEGYGSNLLTLDNAVERGQAK
jgi:hypothetical protein